MIRLNIARSSSRGRGTPGSSRPGGAGSSPERAAVGLGRYLRAARLNGGWSYNDLAEQAGLDRVTVIALESGLLQTAAIRPEWLDWLAAALGEDVDDLRLLLGLSINGVEPATRPTAEPRRLQLPADNAHNEDATEITAHPSYHGAGWIDCRSRYRSTRAQRDPERLYFDK